MNESNFGFSKADIIGKEAARDEENRQQQLNSEREEQALRDQASEKSKLEARIDREFQEANEELDQARNEFAEYKRSVLDELKSLGEEAYFYPIIDFENKRYGN